jgi:hypothetical protein
LERERASAIKKIQRQAERIRQLEGATNHAGGTPLSIALRERDEAREQIKELIYIAERAIALAEIDFENDKFGVVSELRDGVQRIKEGKK